MSQRENLGLSRYAAPTTEENGLDSKSEPLISIITSTFNAGDALARTAASIRAQSYRGIQWIVIDGGSRDGTVDEIRRMSDLAHRRRLSVKPGLTCLWQVSGRNQILDFKDWVRLDLEYIDNWSLWLDFKILLRTIPAVFGGTGAK